MYKHTITFAAVVGLVFALAPAAQAVDIDISNPLVPAGLGIGDDFQLAFIGSVSLSNNNGSGPLSFTVDPQTEGNIGAYDNFVQTLADMAGIGTSQGINWNIIGSTTQVHARDHAVLGASTPLYNMNPGGKELVATGFNDLWDGTLAALIGWDENGGGPRNETATGSNANGYGQGGLQLGSGGNFQRGRNDQTDSHWMVWDTNPDRNSKVYAMSESLTITGQPADVIPEPSTLVIWALGLLGLGWYGWRKKRAA